MYFKQMLQRMCTLGCGHQTTETVGLSVISVVDGSMWMEKFTLEGKDVLAVLCDDKPEKVAVVPTARVRESS